MSYTIKRPHFRHLLHVQLTYGIVINEYTGNPRRFETRASAKSYADLSGFDRVDIVEIK